MGSDTATADGVDTGKSYVSVAALGEVEGWGRKALSVLSLKVAGTSAPALGGMVRVWLYDHAGNTEK